MGIKPKYMSIKQQQVFKLSTATTYFADSLLNLPGFIRFGSCASETSNCRFRSSASSITSIPKTYTFCHSNPHPKNVTIHSNKPCSFADLLPSQPLEEKRLPLIGVVLQNLLWVDSRGVSHFSKIIVVNNLYLLKMPLWLASLTQSINIKNQLKVFDA